MIELLKSIDELTDAEQTSLAALVCTTEWWDDIGVHRERADALRERVQPLDEAQAFTRDDVIAGLNYAEAVRIMTHFVFSIGAQNLEAARKFLSSGRCAYCQWTYRDEVFDFPAGRVITDEEMEAASENTSAAIREHVKVCPAHPMRELEARHAAELQGARREGFVEARKTGENPCAAWKIYGYCEQCEREAENLYPHPISTPSATDSTTSATERAADVPLASEVTP